MANFQEALDNIYSYLEDLSPLYKGLLSYLDESPDDATAEQNLNALIAELDKREVGADGHEIELDDFLRLVAHLAAYHHRSDNFFPKIFNILQKLKEKIEKHYTNEELFNFFLHAEPLHFLLHDHEMLNFDDADVKAILSSKDNKDVNLYYNPGDVDTPENVAAFQRTGENHQKLSTFIRLNQNQEFNSHVNTNGINFDKKIAASPFETNAFLHEVDNNTKQVREPNLLQYAVFCGSAGIFNTIKEKSPDLLENQVWEYLVCGRSYDILESMREVGVPPPTDNFQGCLELAIKLHHNEFFDSISDEFVVNKEEGQQDQEDAENPPAPPKHLLNPYLRAAIMAHNYEIVARFIKDVEKSEKALNELFQISCKAGFHIIIESISRLPGIKINACGKLSALHKACNIGDINTVNLLLKNEEIDINLQSVSYVHDVTTQDYDGLTALERAIRYHHNKIVELLLSHPKIDVNKKSRWRGNAPLHICAMYGNAKAASLLVQNSSIDVNVQCHDEYRIKNNLTLTGGRETALHYAARFDHPEVIDVLVNGPVKANKDLQNWENKKPIECTTNQTIIDLLK